MRLTACALAALVLGLLATGAAAAPNRVSPRTVIVETDMAQDDAMAILFLLRRPDVRVAAIVVNGNGMARCPSGAANALSLAALAGKPSIPVGCGRRRPLEGSHAFPTEWRRGADDFWGLGRPAKPLRAPAGTGQQVLRSAIGSAKGQVDMMTLGPPTELAVLLSSSLALKKKIRSVTMMGGAVGVTGNVRPTIDNEFAEWNFYIDPHATSVVFRSGLPITLVPLDATNHVPLNAGVARRLGRSPTATFVRNLIEMVTSLPAQYFWDPLAAGVLVEPGIGSYATKRLSVVEAEGPESGRTVESESGAPVRATVSANRVRFERLFTATFR